MSRRRILATLSVAAFVSSASPAPAIDLGLGLFKRRKPNESQTPAKPDPSLKVKQLVATVQSDIDVDRRKSAIVELRTHDPRTNPDIISSLINTLHKDPSPDARALAAETIGGYRSVFTTAANALESAELNDPDKTVRAAAKSALWQYGLNGYRVAAPTATPSSVEPPLAKPTASAKPTVPTNTVTRSPGTDVPFRPITQGPASKASAFPQTNEPPLAQPKANTATVPQQMPSTFSVPQRMPSATEEQTVVPPKPSIVAPTLPPPQAVTPPKSANTTTVIPPSISPDPVSSSLPLPLPSVPVVPTVQPPIGK